MTIYGVAILAGSYIIGLLLGETLGSLLNINANVGGVGFAMFLLMFASDWMNRGYGSNTKCEVSHQQRLVGNIGRYSTHCHCFFINTFFIKADEI
jgi:malonate transporter MadL subunit